MKRQTKFLFLAGAFVAFGLLPRPATAQSPVSWEDALQQAEDGLQEQILTHQRTLEGLTEDMDATGADASRIREEVSRLRQTFDERLDALDGPSGSIAELRGLMDEQRLRIDLVREEIAALHAAVTDHEGRIVNLERYNALVAQPTLETHTTEIQGLGVRLDNLRNRLNIGARVVGLLGDEGGAGITACAGLQGGFGADTTFRVGPCVGTEFHNEVFWGGDFAVIHRTSEDLGVGGFVGTWADVGMDNRPGNEASWFVLGPELQLRFDGRGYLGFQLPLGLELETAEPVVGLTATLGLEAF